MNETTRSPAQAALAQARAATLLPTAADLADSDVPTRASSVHVNPPRLPGRDDLSRALAPAALFVMAHAACAAFFIILIRQNLEEGAGSVLAASLHLGALVGCILGALNLAERKDPSKADAALVAGALAAYALPLFGYAFGPVTLILTGLLTFLGLYRALRDSLGSGILTVLSACAGGTFTGAWASITLNAEIYAQALSHEFILLGWSAADPTFHSAIAHLFQTYGTITNGIDGTSFMFYHVVSHLLVAGAAVEAGESIPLVYAAMQQIFFVPALILGTCAAIISLSDRRPRYASLAPFLVILWWMLYEHLGAFNSFLLSESYAVSLGLMAFGAVYVAAGPKSGTLILWLVLAGLLAVAAVAAKFTVALALMLLLTYGLWNGLKDYSKIIRRAVLGAGFAGYGILVILLLLFLDIENNFEWFGYARRLTSYYIVSLGMLGVGVASALIGRRIGLQVPAARHLILLFAALHFPDSIVYAMSNEYYWFHPGDYLLGIIFLAAALALCTAGSRKLGFPILAVTPISVAIMSAVLLTGETFPRSINTLATTLLAFEKLENVNQLPALAEVPAGTRSHSMAREMLVALGEEPPDPGLGSLPESLQSLAGSLLIGVPARLDQIVEETPLAVAARHIRQEQEKAPQAKQALHVDPGNTWYWQGQSDCFARPFALQSETGLALIAGRPAVSDRCPDSHFYGLEVEEIARNRGLTKDEICGLAARSDVDRVIVIAAPAQVSSISCRP